MSHHRVNDLASNNPGRPLPVANPSFKLPTANPPQGDTTINSEVHQILTDFSDGLDFVLEVADDAPLDDPDFFDRPYLDATTALTNLIAQEANKARIDEIDYWFKTYYEPDSGWLNTPAISVQRIKDRIAQLTSEEESSNEL